MRIIVIIFSLIMAIALSSFLKNKRNERTYYKNGNVESELYFDSACNCKKYFEYFENGNVKIKRQYSTLGIEGSDTIFYLSGKPNMISAWRNGIPSGKQIGFYEDGKIASEQYYQDGFKKGIWKYLDTNGIAYRTMEYEDNIVLWNSNLETNITKYFSNGTLFLIETYNDNKKVQSKITDEELFKQYENSKQKTGEGLFIAKCSMCHFMKDEPFAPSVNNLKNNHNESWLLKKISNEDILLNDKDNQASKEKWHSGKHPNFENLTETEIKKIIDYIK